MGTQSLTARLVTGLACALAVFTAGCGVPLDDNARALPAPAQPTLPTAPEGTQPAETAATEVWFVEADGLVPVVRQGPSPVTSASVIELLVLGPTDDERAEGLRGGLTPATGGDPLVRVADEVAGAEPLERRSVVMALSETFTGLSSREQVLLLGEIVLSLTSNGARTVTFVDDDGEPLSVPNAQGRLLDRPAVAADYASLRRG